MLFLKTFFARFKVYFFITYTILVIGGTLYTHNKFLDAAKVKTAEKQIESLGKGQNEIIKFNQQLRKTNASKDPCFNTDLPSDVKLLLSK